MTKPTYDLNTVKFKVNTLKGAAFTASALNGGQGELGLTLAEMIATICSATDGDCYKTCQAKVFMVHFRMCITS